MVAQLTFGLMSGVEKVDPIAEGDVIVTHKSERHVVRVVSDNIHGAVYLTTNLKSGADCVVLEREIAYRSRG